LNRAGCTFLDILPQVLTEITSRWASMSYFFFRDDVILRYSELIDALHHMCGAVAPGTAFQMFISCAAYWA